MQAEAIKILIAMLVKMFDPELMRKFVMNLLTWVEAEVIGSASKLDDAIVLPLCSAVKRAFNLEEEEADK